jgi:hypothetical protein
MLPYVHQSNKLILYEVLLQSLLLCVSFLPYEYHPTIHMIRTYSRYLIPGHINIQNSSREGDVCGGR